MHVAGPPRTSWGSAAENEQWALGRRELAVIAVLAYIFWHRPAVDVDAADYESALAGFHEALARERPEGFVRSAAFNVSQAPWLPGTGTGTGTGTAYEDWYLLSGTAALDPLDEAAIGLRCAGAHGTVAALASAGSAGLYGLKAGHGSKAGHGVLDLAASATWTDLPIGITRADFTRGLEERASNAKAGLWVRRMTLGPAPEFCILGDEVAPGGGIVVTRTVIWADPGRES
ncbi:MAG: hypothetical protein ACYDD6_09715 [Acidimicrobiales bacterium]